MRGLFPMSTWFIDNGTIHYMHNTYQWSQYFKETFDHDSPLLICLIHFDTMIYYNRLLLFTCRPMIRTIFPIHSNNTTHQNIYHSIHWNNNENDKGILHISLPPRSRPNTGKNSRGKRHSQISNSLRMYELFVFHFDSFQWVVVRYVMLWVAVKRGILFLL